MRRRCSAPTLPLFRYFLRRRRAQPVPGRPIERQRIGHCAGVADAVSAEHGASLAKIQQ
jgi:hypothetical protein